MTRAFEPINAAHALAETIFFGQFKPHLTADDLVAFSDDIPEIQKLMPQRKPMKRFEIVFGPDGTQSTNEVDIGIEFLRTAPDGSIEWLLRILPENFSIHCTNYTRWAEVWNKAQGIIKSISSHLPSGLSLSKIGLKNTDKFLFSDSIDNYRFEYLFKDSSAFLAPFAKEAGPFWHCNTGWFEEIPDGILDSLKEKRILSQLNVSSATGSDDDETILISKIEHNLVLQALETLTLRLQVNDIEDLEPLMRHLHLINKRCLSHVLTSDMCARINLVPGERA